MENTKQKKEKLNSSSSNEKQNMFQKTFLKMFEYQEPKPYDFNLIKKEELSNDFTSTSSNFHTNTLNKKNKSDDPSSTKNKENESLKEMEKIFPSLDVNLQYMKSVFSTDINSDVVLREFIINARNKQYSAFLIHIDGMVDSKTINDFVLEPLMLKNRANTFDGTEDRVLSEAVTNNITVRKVKKFDLEDYIYDSLVPQNNIKKSKDYKEIISGINSGNCALFIDTIDVCFDIDVKGFEKRNSSAPMNEVVIRGSGEAFVESIRINTSMLRRIINNQNLIIENANIGEITKTSVAICYMKNIANNSLVEEVKNRVDNLAIDSLLSAGELEQLIQDNLTSIFPQVLSTERPDKATEYLLEGRVVVIVNGSPYVLIMPATLVDFMSSPEDINLKFQFGNLLKVIRFAAVFLALLLPGIYVAVTNYHHELIPTELLFTIAASREFVPFPTIFEILLMEMSFELIREAGLRVPNPIGSTIGIVGALVLGDAAVSANLVSPILIIVVAVTGISSFAIPDFSLNFTLRISRFIYIILGYMAGFLGLAFGLFIQLTLLCNLKSFGVSYIRPYVTSPNKRTISSYFIHPIWKREKNSSFLHPKKNYSQEPISMKWRNKNSN